MASIRQEVYAEVRTRLDAITAGDDYATTPVIYETMADAFASDATVAIWTDYGDETPRTDGWRVGPGGGGGPVALEINVNILVRSDGTGMMAQGDAALADVRNALCANWGTWKSETGADFVGLDTCTTDEGNLSYDGMMLYVQPAVFTYMAGPTW